MKFSSSQLDNGFTVITDHIPDSKGIALHWCLTSGARDEEYHGVAHFLEHLIANAKAGKDGQEVIKRFDKITDKRTNFSTGPEVITSFAYTLPEFSQEIIETWGKTISRPHWNSEIFKREKKRILDEYDMLSSDPERVCVHEHISSIIRPGSPQGHGVIGPLENIHHMTEEHVLAYMHDNFHAQRMCLTVSGPIAHEQILEWAQKSFGSLVMGTPTTPRQKIILPSNETRIFPRQEGRQQLFITFPGFQHDHPLKYAAIGTALLFEEGLKKIVNEKGYYSDPEAYNLSLSDFGKTIIQLPLKPEEISQILQEVSSLLSNPDRWLTKEAYNDQLLGDKIFYAFNALNVEKRASRTSYEWQTLGTIKTFDELQARYMAISLDYMFAVYESWDTSQLNIFACGPAQNIPSPQEILGHTSKPRSPFPTNDPV